jgi:L-rhamnose mutarotase
MAKVIFSIQYEINDEKRNEFISTAKELKTLLKAEGLENYSIYEVKGKKNHFQEVYLFSSEEAYENFDDNQNERMNILINKISEMTIDNSSRYTTLIEMVE